MAETSTSASPLEILIDRLGAGDLSARELLIQHTLDRLRRLTRKMLRGFPGVHRWDATDDVLQSAMLRLFRSMEAVQPDSAQAFFALATTQIRRELIDLARRYSGPEGLGANQESYVQPESGPRCEKEETTREPSRLAEWTEFHQQVETLPEKERQIFGLLYYQGFKQDEAAGLLKVDISTVQRRWIAALKTLRHVLKDGIPGI